MLTLKRLKELIHYDPKTGIFTRIKSRRDGWTGRRADRPSDDGYCDVYVQEIRPLAHRLAWFYMTGEWPVDALDHKNGNRADNRFSNLRPANARLNAVNRKAIGRSGFKGVYWHKRVEKWGTSIKGHHLGFFRTKKEAAAAYLGAAKIIYKEFTRLR